MSSQNKPIIQTTFGKQRVKFSYGPLNKIKKDHQEIRITEGCPNQCPFCYEPKEIVYFGIPEIVKNSVKIVDMNLICKEKALGILYELPDTLNKKRIRYELICGIDYRFLNQELADWLYFKNFKKPRIAWDFEFDEQYNIKDSIEILLKAGYKRKDILVFMLVNWHTTYETNLKKLDLCKVWNVKVGDCPYDGQEWKKLIPIDWTMKELRDFRKRVRKHNQMVNFGVDPEWNKKK